MPRPRARAQGLALVSDLSDASFGPFLRQLAKRGKGGVEGVSELTRQRLANVCSALHQQVQAALERAADTDHDAAAEHEPSVLEDAVMTLHGAAMLALELLAKSEQRPPEQLLAVAVLLHDGALMSQVDPQLGNMQIDMQDAVMRLCCAWWEQRMPGNELLVARTIPYVLLRAIQSLDRNKASLVHMCYVIREALELLDYEDETIKDTKRLLLVAAMHPAFLREAEGRRFIAGLFKLEPQMTRELGAIVRNQIPSGQRFALEAYGEILFRAWRDTVGPCAAEVESELQALVQAALVASTPALAAALRIVLNVLHSHKNIEKRLNPALVRLYDPILSRAFGAANAEVRRNAVNLLASAFPIIDPDAPAEENNTRLTHQLGLLMENLADSCPAVREAAVEGCCRCLRYFWEIIPAATSAKMIDDITGKLAFDGSSRSVRIAVLRGLRVLADNQHAQPVLKKALPGVSSLFHDSDPGVREALADLLVGVSVCRGLHFWGLVPPEQLLDVVASDPAPAVARKVARILVPSFFTNAQEGSARVGALLRANPDAGLAFCRHIVARYLPDDQMAGVSGANITVPVPLEQVLQLASDLTSHLLATAPGTSPAARQPRQPPPKRAKPSARRVGKTGAPSGPVAGKKRGKKTPADAGSESEESVAQVDGEAVEDDVAAAAGQEDGGDDVVLQDSSAETEEGWLAILAGLVVLCEGLGAAVATTEECTERELAAALGDAVQQLWLIAEEQLHNPKAMELVLQLVTHVHFIPGAQSARGALFDRLAQGSLPGLGFGDDSEPLEDGASSQPDGIVVLSAVLKTLGTGNNSPKLAAMLVAALGVREAMPIRKPAVPRKKGTKAAARDRGGDGDQGLAALEQMLAGDAATGHGEGQQDDDILCHGCGCAQPEDTMLLCDGCDAACHIHCLRPPLQHVPESEWFCWQCESQLQAVQLQPAAAGRCVCLLLQHEAGRQLLCKHESFGDIIEAMKQLAIAEADEILRLAQGAVSDDADSFPANAAATGERTDLLDDPWGALSRYCRAALHRAMWAASPHSAEPEANQDAPASALPTPRQTPAVRGRGCRGKRAAAAEDGDVQQPTSLEDGEQIHNLDDAATAEAPLLGFYEIVPVIDYAVQTCGHLGELVKESCLAAQLAALRFGQGLLQVLYVVHQTDLMNMGDQYVATVAALCGSQVELARAAAATLAGQGGGTAEQQSCVSGTLQAVLGLTQQMAESIRMATQGDAIAGVGVTPCPAPVKARRHGLGDGGLGEGQHADEGDLPSRQLESRIEAAAGADGVWNLGVLAEQQNGELPPSRVSVERLAAALVSLLCEPAVAALNKGPVRLSTAALVGELLTSAEREYADGWLGTLCQRTGEAFTGCDVDSHLAVATAEAGEKDQARSAAAAVADLVQQEAPEVAALASLVVRVATAQKVHGRTMLLLARLASRAQAAGHNEACGQALNSFGARKLGAVYMLSQLKSASVANQEAQPAGRRKAAGRRGALGQGAAAQGECAEAEAATRALDTICRAFEVRQPLKPVNQQQMEAQPPHSGPLLRRLVQELVSNCATGEQ